jgi:hypothetical protein
MAAPDFIITKKSRTAYSNKVNLNKKRGFTSSSNQQQRTVSQNTAVTKKETLYTGEHDLGNGPYAVKIITSTTE